MRPFTPFSSWGGCRQCFLSPKFSVTECMSPSDPHGIPGNVAGPTWPVWRGVPAPTRRYRENPIPAPAGPLSFLWRPTGPTLRVDCHRWGSKRPAGPGNSPHHARSLAAHSASSPLTLSAPSIPSPSSSAFAGLVLGLDTHPLASSFCSFLREPITGACT